MKKSVLLLLMVFYVNSYAQEYKFGKVSQKELKEKFYEKDSTASAAYLLKKRSTHYEYDNVLRGFVLVTDVHERIKIYNKEGFKFANKGIEFYKPSDKEDIETVSGIKAITFNLVNGKIISTKTSNKQVFEEKKSKYKSVMKIAIPDIREGSVVDFKYQLRSPHIAKVDDVNFQYTIPVKQYYAKIKIPEYYVFSMNTKGFYFITHKESYSRDKFTYTDGFGPSVSGLNAAKSNRSLHNYETEYKVTEYEFEGNDIPALNEKEPYIGSIENYRGGVSFELTRIVFPNSPIKSYATTWNKVSQSIYGFESFGGQFKKTKFFKDDLAILIDGVDSDIEKINKIFNHVKSKVKWNKYKGKYSDIGVKETYENGVGNVADINLLLTSMLREAGLSANPVLLSTKSNGIPVFPTIDGFDYVICSVERDDGTNILLDATEKYNTPGVLPIRAINWKGRKVSEKEFSRWINLEPKLYALRDEKIYLKFSEENVIEGLFKTSITNQNALEYRNSQNNLSEEEITSKIEEECNIEIDEFRIFNKFKCNKPISYSYKFSSDNYLEEIGGKLYLNPMLFAGHNQNPFKSNERNYPVDFNTPWKEKLMTSITIPDNYKIEYLPKFFSSVLPDELGSFNYKVSQNGNTIKLVSVLQINKRIIIPKYYKTLKTFYTEIIKKQSDKIVLIKE